VDTAVYDIPQQVKSRGPLMSGVYTAAFGKNEASQKKLSPISHVAKDQGIPPFLILHVADRPDSTAQSLAFAKALENAGVQAKVVPGEGKTHGTINRDLGLPNDEPTQAVFEFLDELLENN
jgi:acetyl esterase/lipase